MAARTNNKKNLDTETENRTYRRREKSAPADPLMVEITPDATARTSSIPSLTPTGGEMRSTNSNSANYNNTTLNRPSSVPKIRDRLDSDKINHYMGVVTSLMVFAVGMVEGPFRAAMVSIICILSVRWMDHFLRHKNRTQDLSNSTEIVSSS